MKKIWIATYVDIGETCDGKPRVLTTASSKEEILNEVRADIEKWADDRAGEGIEVDFDRMRAHYDYDSNCGCEWNIEEIDIEPYDYKKNLAATEQILVDNGIDEDEASTVLQAVGYSLLNTELYPED